MTEQQRGSALGFAAIKFVTAHGACPRALALAAVSGSMVILGCSSTTTTEQAVVLEQPRTTAGMLVDEPTQDGLAEIQAARTSARIARISGPPARR